MNGRRLFSIVCFAIAAVTCLFVLPLLVCLKVRHTEETKNRRIAQVQMTWPNGLFYWDATNVTVDGGALRFNDMKDGHEVICHGSYVAEFKKDSK